MMILTKKLKQHAKYEFEFAGFCMDLSSWCFNNNIIESGNSLRMITQSSISSMMNIYNKLAEKGVSCDFYSNETLHQRNIKSPGYLMEKILTHHNIRIINIESILNSALKIANLPVINICQNIKITHQNDGLHMLNIIERMACENVLLKEVEGCRGV
ncbi:hypothetical protein [Mangrovibacter phragmitis]|nr:hypothetical protein [Mangrovibacter phragmitis]